MRFRKVVVPHAQHGSGLVDLTPADGAHLVGLHMLHDTRFAD